MQGSRVDIKDESVCTERNEYDVFTEEFGREKGDQEKYLINNFNELCIMKIFLEQWHNSVKYFDIFKERAVIFLVN